MRSSGREIIGWSWLVVAWLAGCFPDLELPTRSPDAGARAAMDAGDGSVGRPDAAGVAADSGSDSAVVADAAATSSATDSGGNAGAMPSEGAGGTRDAGGESSGDGGSPTDSGGVTGMDASVGVFDAGAVGDGSAGDSGAPTGSDCTAWLPVNILDEAVPAGAWAGAQETVEGVDTFTHYVCRGAPVDGGTKHVGKGSFGYGCYVPVEPDGSAAVSRSVDILTTSGEGPCLAWASGVPGVPIGRAVAQAGEYVCRVSHTGSSSFQGNPQSSGGHVGQLRELSGAFTCYFEFYGAVLSEDDPAKFEVLVRGE